MEEEDTPMEDTQMDNEEMLTEDKDQDDDNKPAAKSKRKWTQEEELTGQLPGEHAMMTTRVQHQQHVSEGRGN